MTKKVKNFQLVFHVYDNNTIKLMTFSILRDTYCRCLWNNYSKKDTNYFTENSGFGFNYVSKLTNKYTCENEKTFII